MPGAEAAHDVGAIVLALGEEGADTENLVQRWLQKNVDRRLAVTAVPLANGLANRVVDHLGAQAQQAAGHIQIGRGLQVEDDVVGH